jgi:ABC-2 type transport system ATP-binding protein
VAALPKQERTSVRDLERLEALRLYVALALIGRPGLLAVDDTDLKLSDVDRAEAWQLLRSVAEAGTTVLAVCSQAPEGATAVRTIAVENTSTAESASTAEETGTAESTETAESTGTADNTVTAENTETTEDTTESTTDDEDGTADAIAETRRA